MVTFEEERRPADVAPLPTEGGEAGSTVGIERIAERVSWHIHRRRSYWLPAEPGVSAGTAHVRQRTP